ncbi:MAG: AAA family ATPase [Caldilineales bacterium]|nr:AAA family ATPase [Caldilineales bacterium]
MICTNCQANNPEGARFCNNCGNRLNPPCPNCGHENPPGAKFCNNCGWRLGEEVGSREYGVGRAEGGERKAEGGAPATEHGTRNTEHATSPTPWQRFIPTEFAARLEAARSARAMEGERRIVTMLFSDVKGSTALAESLDPEEWAEIMNGAFEHLIRPVYKYEGIVARLMGDAILALFGAPIAHEDDPQRAILAGLEILEGMKTYAEQVRRRWKLEMGVRVGINTGLVVVGAVGSDLRMEYTAMGDAINLAARMEQTAQPGTVQIAHDTYKLTAPLFEFEDLGGIEVKGKAEPAPAYRVLRPKTQPGRLRGIAGLESPLVGREYEMNRLRQALVALTAGSGQFVAVMGEAGLGKSRLVSEFRTTAGLTWLEGRSLSYETATPYAPFVPLLRSAFGLQPDQPDAEQMSRIKEGLGALLGGEGAAQAPFFGALLGLKLSGDDLDRIRYLEPPTLRGHTFGAVVGYVAALASVHPLALVFDDVHWIDPTSLELIEHLLPLTQQAPLLILTLFRPREDEPAWRLHLAGQKSYRDRYTAISLRPLDDDSARQLVANLLHIEGLPEQVRQLILRKAEGNPFFVEEVIRSLLDARLVVRDGATWRATRAIENIAVPDTLAGVITARLDRLDEHDKRVAQTASVIGREFAFPILQQIFAPEDHLDDALTELERRELVLEKSRLPQRIHTFKHVLTQETAYSTLLLSKRRELHRRVAECLEQVEPGHVADIARHFLEAHLPARALPYLVQAGDNAARAYSTPEAIGYYRKALDILQTVDDLKLARRAYEGLGNALSFDNQIAESLRVFQDMLAQARVRGDHTMAISALNKLAYVTAMRAGDFTEAEGYLAEADQMARRFQDKYGLSELSLVRCMMCTMAADFEGVVRYLDETKQIGYELGEKEQIAMALDHISNSQMMMTQFDKGWQTAQEGLRLAREVGNREHEASILASVTPLYHLRNGDLAQALHDAKEGTDLALQIGALYSTIYGLWVQGLVAWLRGEYETALAYFQQSLDRSRPVQEYMPFLAVQPLASLGSVYLEISPDFAPRALELHTEALALLDSPAGMMGGGTAWADTGLCALTVGNLSLAAELLQKGLNQPTMFMLLERPRFLVGLGRIALAEGRTEEARRQVEEAREYAENRGMRNLYPLIDLTLAQIAAAAAAWNVALAHDTAAANEAQALGMRPYLWQAQAGMALALAALGRDEEAEVSRTAAAATIAEIAALFKDDDLRARFLAQAQR